MSKVTHRITIGWRTLRCRVRAACGDGIRQEMRVDRKGGPIMHRVNLYRSKLDWLRGKLLARALLGSREQIRRKVAMAITVCNGMSHHSLDGSKFTKCNSSRSRWQHSRLRWVAKLWSRHPVRLLIPGAWAKAIDAIWTVRVGQVLARRNSKFMSIWNRSLDLMSRQMPSHQRVLQTTCRLKRIREWTQARFETRVTITARSNLIYKAHKKVVLVVSFQTWRLSASKKLSFWAKDHQPSRQLH